MNTILHIVEPKRLLLIWQGPEGCSRVRHVVGELSTHDKLVELRYFVGTPDMVAAKSDGFLGHPAFTDLNNVYRSGVLEAFLRRIPPRSRDDFPAYLAQLRLPNNVKISDFALLGYSGARLPTDGFSVIHTFENYDGPFEFVTEVAGFRHQAPEAGLNVADLVVGESITLVAEPTNPVDPLAVQVLLRGKRIGYMPRGMQQHVLGWLGRKNVEATIDRLNGRPERPSVYLFVKISN